MLTQTAPEAHPAGGPPAEDAREAFTVRAQLVPIDVTVRPVGPDVTPEVTFTDATENGADAMLERRFFFQKDDDFVNSSVKTAVAGYRDRRSGRRVGARRAAASVEQALRDAFARAADAGAPVNPEPRTKKAKKRETRSRVGCAAGKSVSVAPSQAGGPKPPDPGPDRQDEAVASSAGEERSAADTNGVGAPPDLPAARHERPRLAVRALPRGTREAALAVVEYSLPSPDRRLPARAADFLKMLAANDLRVRHAAGADADDFAAGSHLGFTVLAEMPGATPEKLEAFIVEQVRDLVGDDSETA